MAIGLMGNWMCGSSVESMQDLGLEVLGILISFSDYITALYDVQLPVGCGRCVYISYRIAAINLGDIQP